MMRLTIDGVAIPLEVGATLPAKLFAYDAKQLHDIEGVRQGRELTLTIPASAEAAALFGSADEAYPTQRFNASAHTAVVEYDGCEVMSGVVHLIATEYDTERLTSYALRIREGGGGWADRAAITDIEQSKVAYSAQLGGEAIAASWAEESAVKFLPVKSDSYEADTPHSPLTPREKILSVADYHPFLSVEKIIRAIFEPSEYTLKSRWLESPLARSLHISGAYSSHKASSVARLNAIAGFAAGRKESITAKANGIGIVFATPTVAQNTVGNFVTTCNAEDGEGLYDNSHSLTFSSDGITFTPAVAMTVGFDLKLRYTTPFAIASLRRLRCFDRVMVEPTCDVKFEVANPFSDVREEIRQGVAHSLYIFGYEGGPQYRYRWVADSSPKAWQSITSRQTTLTPPSGSTLKLEVQRAEGSLWKEMEAEEWGIYQAYVEQIKTIDIEVDISTAPEQLSPEKPKVFNTMYISGGEPEWELTLHPECRLTPRFTASPAIGSELDFASVARLGVKQIELLKAVAQMFNLTFYTDERHKVVYIEPYDELYATEVVDIRERILLGGGIRLSDAAQQVGQIRRLSYLSEGGGAVTRYNTKHSTTVGVWSTKTPSHIARQGVEHNQNGLFCPTLTTTDVLISAPSAGFLSVGDRDGDSVEDNRIRIVRYQGLVELPEGESWGFPSADNSYPFAAFHYPRPQSEESEPAVGGDTPVAGGDENFTLCFEDRDGEQGLNHYYTARYNEEALSQRITLALRLDIGQMGELFSPESQMSLLSLYRIAVGGESIIARIDAVESYDAESQVAVIRFIRLLRDE
jgi:hypothetical protein